MFVRIIVLIRAYFYKLSNSIILICKQLQGWKKCLKCIVLRIRAVLIFLTWDPETFLKIYFYFFIKSICVYGCGGPCMCEVRCFWSPQKGVRSWCWSYRQLSAAQGMGTKIGSCAKTTKVSSSPKTLRLCLAILDYLFINRLPRPGWSWIPCIAKDDLEPLILIPLPPACWDHRQVSAELGLYPLSHLLSHVKGSFFFFCVWLRVGSSNTR